MREKSKQQNSLLAVAILMAVALSCNRQETKSRDVKEATKNLNAAAADLAKLPSKEQLTTAPYIKGKLVMVRQYPSGAYYVDAFDAGQLGDVYAQTPEEAQTVALTVCQRSQKGVYRTDENPPRELPAFATDCDVTLIDRSIAAVIFKRRFEAKLGEKAGGISTTTEINAYPDYEIRDFLKALPRK